MANIDINFKNSEFYIVEIRVDDYSEGEHSFYTSKNVYISKREAEKAKNEYFQSEISSYFTENINIPEDLFDYDNYDISNDNINDYGFNMNYSYIDSENVYISTHIKQLILNTNL